MKREELVKKVGEANVEKLEAVDCDFTNRLMPDNDSRIEFKSAFDCVDVNGNDCSIECYYYVDQDWIDVLREEQGEDVDWMNLVSWEIDHYAIV